MSEQYTRKELDEHMTMARQEGFAAALRYAAYITSEYDGEGTETSQYSQLGDASQTKSDIEQELLAAIPNVAELAQEDY